MREEQIKLAVVRWLLSQIQGDEVIATELHFNSSQNRADIVVSSPNRLAAYEIKSSYDDFRRYTQQKEAYQAAFLESYLVLPDSMLKTARDYLDRTTGILTIDEEGNITKRRKPQVKVKIGLRSALSWLTSSETKKLQRKLGSASIVDELTAQSATQLALESIYERLRFRYANFTRERGQVLTTDDLSILSSPTSIR